MPDESTPPSSTPPPSAGDAGAGRRAPGGSGLEENVAGALSYLLGPVTGVIFLILDKDRPFVRFHAVQCLVATVAWLALSLAFMVVSVVPILGVIISTLAYIVLSLAGFVLWLALMYKALQGEEWEIPVLGEYARRYEARV